MMNKENINKIIGRIEKIKYKLLSERNKLLSKDVIYASDRQKLSFNRGKESGLNLAIEIFKINKKDME